MNTVSKIALSMTGCIEHFLSFFILDFVLRHCYCFSKKLDSHIEVGVGFGEGKGKVSLKNAMKRAEERKPKAKTTYKDIQNYVEKNYGFKVHTAYIAEVKRNSGLPMYDAPNAVLSVIFPTSPLHE